ncbi:MAG TPA: hypothetical protein PLU81_13215 [Deltaproteobacteria bacterium]|nr:hypothetical protein [Deltaproteobacteria bacterium]HPJ94022.1 hypothetical protein [Deltaproteobacteria bacterium]HPR52747.1 hypothetical protein [Deltaproteobacteria bacterium]
MKFRHAKVKTLDSHTYPGRPCWVEIDGNGQDIEAVVDHWREAYIDASFYPQEYFKVLTADRNVYVLRYSTLFKSWWISESGEKE